MHATDLPKRDSTLPEAASERIGLPTSALSPLPFWARSCSIVTRIRPVHHDPRVLDAYDATFCIQRTGAPYTTRTAFIATRPPPAIRLVSRRIRPSLISVLGRSPTPDGPTACLTPTHRTRQRISRHSPSPTSHDTSTSREETIRLSPFLSTRAPADTTTSRA
jgi:hypothetical protein